MLPGRGVWDPHWTLLQSNWAGRASGMVNRGTLALFGLWGSHAGFSTLPLCSAVLIHFSRVRLFATPLTVARQALLSMGISRQEYWSGLPCPPPGDLPNLGIKPVTLMSSALAGGFFTASTTCDPLFVHSQATHSPPGEAGNPGVLPLAHLDATFLHDGPAVLGDAASAETRISLRGL